MVLMPYFLRFCLARATLQPISKFVTKHASKGKTPTMGGIVFITATLLGTLIAADLSNIYVQISLLGLVGFASIGLVDDYSKIAIKSNAGMSSGMKFLLISALAVIICALLIYVAGFDMKLYLPFYKRPIFICHLGILAIIFWTFIINATSNAVNLTDGLDGLATVPSIAVLASLFIFTYISGNIELSRYLFWPNVHALGEVSIIIAALIGALFGFLWFNAYPAEIFMGDSGSLALGGFIGIVSILTHNEILLVLMGAVFVMETLSVIFQVGSYKLRHKRIFLMAPLHHHFEEKGWAENKIIVRFWIIAILSNLLALLSLKIR